MHPDASQLRRGEGGGANRDRGAQGGGQLQRLGERLAGRIHQLGCHRHREHLARGRGAAERVAGGVRRLGWDARRDRVLDLAAVDGRADRAEYVDNVAVRCGPSSEAGLRFFQGTSLASPAVAGVAALMLSKNPALTPPELKAALRNTADRVAGLVGRVSTTGRLNADKAVRSPTSLLTGDDVPPLVKPISDTQPPIVTNLALVPRKFRPLRSGASVRAAATKRGSRLRFRVNETVRVRIAIDARRSGRRVGRRCLRLEPTRRNRRRCTRYVAKGTYLMPGELTGLVRRTFSGRIRRKALKPGPYRLSVTATDLAGNGSKAARKGFRILRRPRLEATR
jgi:hypothetical protein